MSLDVYLEGKSSTPVRRAIFVRDNGQQKEISREEWDRLNPDREPITIEVGGDSDTIYSANITHNMNKMAGAAGIYEHLWRPDEVGVTHAHQLIGPLAKGLAALRESPDKFKVHNPSNGWGSYEGLVEFVADYLEACKQHPDAIVRVWR